MPDDAIGIEKQKTRILGYVMMYSETRVNGYPECWQAIQRAVEEPDRTIKDNLETTGYAILQSFRVSMLKDNIQMCVDSKFNKY